MSLQKIIDERQPLSLEQENSIIQQVTKGLRRDKAQTITRTLRYSLYSFFDGKPYTKHICFAEGTCQPLPTTIRNQIKKDIFGEQK